MDKNEFEEWYYNHSIKDTASHFSISVDAVFSWRSKFELQKKRQRQKNRISKDEFEKWYYNHSYIDTAAHFGLSTVGVWRLAERFGCKRKQELDISKREFEEYFSNHSQEETATHFEICITTVCKLARQFGIKRRYNRYKDFIDTFLSERQKDILIGSLLGDGSLGKVGINDKHSYFREMHCLKQEEYLLWKYKELQPFATTLRLNKINNKKYLASKFNTMRHPVFTEMEREWYLRDENCNYVFKNNHRIKIVPPSIKLTPLSLAVWYLDDGHRPKKDRQHFFAAMGFTFDECNFLVEQIKQMGVTNCRVRSKIIAGKSVPDIAIGAVSSLDFLNLIESQVEVKCMDYKVVKRYLLSS